ncbi:UbiX family flavin prenyltransferase [Brucella sp. BO3]|uniref:UbiX family flavin prenyltransferase n=1 Tax=unclassified Brucella TaxID=2632610 RepID=UPI00084F9893|nr:MULTISPECIES: UbiX family flavin prenyltransferase [unclassified Brucella]OEI84962.1 phenolic acid decarboxylase [Brucella sp. B13-0095]QMV27878.1 UbiX family flavin prenyltransferase [Brucella sp. BO3]
MKRIVIGVSGASGSLIPLKILERLAVMEGVETHLVISDAAQQTLRYELGANGYSLLYRLAARTYAVEDVGAAIASGSVPTAGMIIAPCSMRTLSAIANGYSDSLLTRAADVHLKERRKLVLIARETPLHLVHLRNMCTVTEMGAIVMPPVPAFYLQPQTVEDVASQVAARAIDLIGVGTPQAQSWNPEEKPRRKAG